MKRYLIAVLVGGMVFTTVMAAAATLDLDGGVAQAGTDHDLECQESPLEVRSYRLNNNENGVGSHGVRIGDFDAACADAGTSVHIHAYSDEDAETLVARTAQTTVEEGELSAAWDRFFNDAEGTTFLPYEDIEAIQVVVESDG